MENQRLDHPRSPIEQADRISRALYEYPYHYGPLFQLLSTVEEYVSG
ncbi:hypothetical protein [Syntrophobacter fumaroxidans]|nr:hypothetical protein [Syntrophobacter fumaroxidans]